MAQPYDYYKHYELVKKNPGEYVIPPNVNDALLPAEVIVAPTDEMYSVDKQLQRTVNFGVCRTPGGRIFMSYFSATHHADENTGNWIIAICSDDDGKTFHDAFAVNPPNHWTTRVYDGIFWIDPKGRMWYLYAQCYARMDGRVGVWAIICDDPDADQLVFSKPRRLCDGVLSNNPVVLSDGRWAFTTYIWDPSAFHGDGHDDFETTDIIWLPKNVGVSVHVSSDEGETFEMIATGIKFPFATFYENSLAERSDGSLWILIRGMNCRGESFSYDGGYTWTPATVNNALPLTNSHHSLVRLKSGNMLLVANYKANMFSYYIGRNNLTALISTDDGKTWGEHCLLLDEREGAEQPAIHEADNGFIYISYGRAPQIAGESLLAIVTEEDILAGHLVNPKSRLKISCGRSTGMKFLDYYKELTEIAEKHGIEL